MKPNMKVRRVIAHATHHRISLHSVKISGFQPKLLYAVAYVPPEARFRVRGGFSVALPWRRRAGCAPYHGGDLGGLWQVGPPILKIIRRSSRYSRRRMPADG